jgi:hypothetical protein
MNSEKTTRTYLLANPNLEGEIHLKGVRLVTSQFLGKEFIKFSHEIMHHFMHTITLHLHTFSIFCFVLESKPSLYVSNNRRKVLQISKCDLSSNQKLFASFQKKNQKKTEKKEKENRKNVKRPRGSTSARDWIRPTARSPSLPKPVPILSLLPLMRGPHMSSRPERPGRTW